MKNNLKDLREEIDSLDNKLLDILAKRMDIVEKIGEIKKKNGLEPLDEKRWESHVESILLQAKSFNLVPTFIKKIFEVIHEYALFVQRDQR